MNKAWYKLDNAALIYPPSKSKRWIAMFRIAAVLKEEVDPIVLQKAADDVLPRFPTLKVELRAGFFWYYFDENNTKFTVAKETKYPCQMIRLINRNYLFRVMYQNNRVIFEAFHALTDGSGAFVFLNTLLRRYFELLGMPVTGYDGCVNYLDIPAAEEFEDSFNKNADFKNFTPRKEDKAYQIRAPKSEPGVFWLTHGTADAAAVKAAAKSYGVSVGPFLTAVYLYSLYLYKESLPYKKNNKRIKLSIIADLRRVFDSKTLRNFAMYMNFGIDGNRKYIFGEVLETVRDAYPLMSREYLLGVINANVKSQKNILIRVMPVFLKNLALKISYRILGETLNTSTFSNIGPINAPPEYREYVERYESVIGPQKQQGVALSALAFNGRIVITFSARAREPAVERMFFRTLSGLGIDVTVDGNRGDYGS